MTLRGTDVRRDVTLPDGRRAVVRVGMANDDYIPDAEEETVVLELLVGDRHEAALNTVLDPDQDEAAQELAQQVADGLAKGRIEPTAAALEKYADRLR